MRFGRNSDCGEIVVKSPSNDFRKNKSTVCPNSEHLSKHLSRSLTATIGRLAAEAPVARFAGKSQIWSCEIAEQK